MLPPVNTCDGDTDNELGDDNSLTSVTLDCVAEVTGTLEVQSSRKTSRISKPKKGGYSELPPNYKALTHKQVLKVIKLIDNNNIDHDSKVDGLIEHATIFDSFRQIRITKKMVLNGRDR